MRSNQSRDNWNLVFKLLLSDKSYVCSGCKHLQSGYFDNIVRGSWDKNHKISVHKISWLHILINAESSRHVVTVKLRIRCCKGKETNYLPSHHFLPGLPMTGSHVGHPQQSTLLLKKQSILVSPPGVLPGLLTLTGENSDIWKVVFKTQSWYQEPNSTVYHHEHTPSRLALLACVRVCRIVACCLFSVSRDKANNSFQHCLFLVCPQETGLVEFHEYFIFI